MILEQGQNESQATTNEKKLQIPRDRFKHRTFY